MKSFKTMFLFALPLALLEPVSYADIAAPPKSMVISIGAAILAAALVVNYIVNLAVSLPLSRIIANTKAGSIAKVLLIITPIMLVFESFFIWILEPRMIEEFIATWLFSFVLIFACYFIAGNKVWDMRAWQASIVAVIMAVITNPTYILAFF